jgi:general secretion pathway protein F
MPVYAYKGVTQAGRNTRGFVDADKRTRRARRCGATASLTDLRERGGEAERRERRIATSRSTCRASAASRRSTSRSRRASSTLIGAAPLVEALSALAEQVETARLKGVIGQIRDRVNEGSTLGDAMAQAGPFSDLYVGMVRAGEAEAR